MTSRAQVSAAYPAERAAALAGVPLRTLYYWAETELVVPSVSRTKLMRWSYADLLVVRLVDWLRQEKADVKIPRTSLRKLRATLERMEGLGGQLFTRGVEVYVDRKGGLVFEGVDGLYIPLGAGVAQGLVDTKVNLVRPFEAHGLRGPDLVRPRPTLRIVPGKLSGEPHIEATRIPTHMLAALARRGFEPVAIAEMYPPITSENVAEALDLEVQLEENLNRRAA